MFTTSLGMLLGLTFGSLAAGPLGGALGLVVGAVFGAMLASAPVLGIRPSPGAELVREQQEVLCMPKGQVAKATYVRDARDGRWLDVERCSLCDPNEEVHCEKRCLPLIRSALPRREHPVEAVAAPTT